MRRRVGVLISGRGSNLQALLDAARDPRYPAEIVSVISNRPGAPGLARAQQAGIPCRTVDHKLFSSREAFEAALDAALREDGVDLVCQAGFMRILTAAHVARWHDRLLNIHPSLLPAFPGLNTHARALAAGVRFHGCTVHVVRAELDAGPIIAQAVVPVLPGDDEAALAARVLAAEHQLYPRALALYAGGAARVAGERIVYDAALPFPAATMFAPQA
jgi:phosphoribosylglycinamide formyltransferase-1